MSGHTPGPYIAKFDEGYTVRAPDGSQLSLMSFMSQGRRRNADEVAATCRLFAAAPELLDALARAIEVIEFAYMNAPNQPKEIAEGWAIWHKATDK